MEKKNITHATDYKPHWKTWNTITISHLTEHCRGQYCQGNLYTASRVNVFCWGESLIPAASSIIHKVRCGVTMKRFHHHLLWDESRERRNKWANRFANLDRQYFWISTSTNNSHHLDFNSTCDFFVSPGLNSPWIVGWLFHRQLSDDYNCHNITINIT